MKAGSFETDKYKYTAVIDVFHDDVPCNDLCSCQGAIIYEITAHNDYNIIVDQ